MLCAPMRQGFPREQEHRARMPWGTKAFRGRERKDEDPMSGTHRVFCLPQGGVSVEVLL